VDDDVRRDLDLAPPHLEADVWTAGVMHRLHPPLTAACRPSS
jgi:hypothetical protein